MNHTNSSGSGSVNPYIQVSPARPGSGDGPTNSIYKAVDRLGKRMEGATRKAERLVDGVWHHLRTSPDFTDAAVTRLAKGAKVVVEGRDRVFQQTFDVLPGEKLINAFACYLSIPNNGPVVGTLYLSSLRIAFHSDHPFRSYSSCCGHPQWLYYKVMIELGQLSAVNAIPSPNKSNSSEKFIQILTRDGHEVRFMGFISYDKAIKNLTGAVRRNSPYLSVDVA